MKRFAHLGRSLSKAEQKQVLGGNDLPPGGGSVCKFQSECSYYESGTGNVTGKCEENSNGSCVCNAGTSSVVLSACNNA